jgi:septum formation protein
MGKDQSLNLPFPLLLASKSRYRAHLLARLGWPFEAIAPGVDEDKVKETKVSPQEMAILLSKLKAQAVAAKFPHACVIGSDQVCSLNGEILGKPGTPEKAREQLSRMQGKNHQLFTAVTIASPEGLETFLNETTLHMRPLTLRDIHQYVTLDMPLDCAGSYKLESRGIKLFHKIETEDETAIVGLPLIELTNRLLQLGYPL